MDHHRSGADHREYEDMLAPAALGALSTEEHAALVAHLRGCASCRETFGRLLGASDSLPLTVEERAPSAALRERLAARVAASPQPYPQPAPDLNAWEAAGDADAPVPLRLEPEPDSPMSVAERLRPGRGVLWALAVAAALLIGLAGGVAIDRFILGDDTADVREVALQAPTGLEIDSARLEYLEERGIVRFVDPDLPSPPEGQVYQVWLIAGDASPPTPVGVIDPATGEFVTSADLERYSVFAVTVEPGPLGSTEPTTQPVIVADLPAPSSA